MPIFNIYSIVDLVLAKVRKEVVRIANVKKGEKILDVCSGTGDQLFYFQRENKIIGEGIDINPLMIKRARRKKEKLAANDISFQLANAKNLPFDKETFDLVIISLALHEMDKEERKKVISEMKRVVKKGGKLIFLDYSFPPPHNLLAFSANLIERSAGKENYSHFQSYLKEGGIEPLLKKNNLLIEKKEKVFFQLLTLIRAKLI